MLEPDAQERRLEGVRITACHGIDGDHGHAGAFRGRESRGWTQRVQVRERMFAARLRRMPREIREHRVELGGAAAALRGGARTDGIQLRSAAGRA
jgi:hypothetical protein